MAYAGHVMPPLPIQYRDYAVWQREQMAAILDDEQEPFWLAQFSGELPTLDLPLDYPRPAYQSFAGDHLGIDVDHQTTKAMLALAEQTETTLFNLLLAAYTVLLSKYTGQDDILAGSPVSGRSNTATEGLIGMFANTLVLRNNPSPALSFSEYLETVKNRTLAAFEHTDLPFERLLDKLALERDLSRNPLFDTLFTMQEKGVPRIESAGLVLTPHDAAFKAAKFDLSMDAVLEKDHLHIGFEYCTALFRRDTVAIMAERFVQLLRNLTTTPGAAIAKLSMLNKEQKAAMLGRLHQPAGERAPICHTLIARINKHPDRVALRFHSQIITYQHLLEKVKWVAGQLQAPAGGTDKLTGLLVRRGPAMIYGLFGILWRGRTYVPIDPDYPPERIAIILEDSGISQVITETACVHLLPDHIGTVLIDAPDDSQAPMEHPAGSLTDLAYIIYTSGSTGRPKGVCISNRSLAWFCEAICQVIDFSEGKTVLSLTTISFDIFVVENLVPLLNGQTVVIASEQQQKDPVLLAALIRESGIQMMQTTPSRLKLIAATDPELGCLAGLNELMIGGEALPPDLLSLLQTATPAEIYNMYGPTEGTVWCSVRNLTQSKQVTIGYALLRKEQDREQRIVVIGDGDFLSNSFLMNAGNQDLGLSLVRWLATDDQMIGIPPNEPQDRELHLSLLHRGVIGLGWLIVVPALLLITGGIITWRRNRA